MAESAPYHLYWGKAGDAESRTYHLLPYHCLDVASVGRWLLEEHEPIRRSICRLTGLHKDVLIRWTVFFLALHDIGKFASAFQQLRPELAPSLEPRKAYSRRHDTLGYHIWKMRLKPTFQQRGLLPARRRGLLPADYWMLAVTGHHGQPPALDELLLSDHFTPADESALLGFVDDLYHLLLPDDVEAFPELDVERIKRASWWLAGFAVLCDWIGSNADYFGYLSSPVFLTAYWERALGRAAQAIGQSELLPATPSERLELQQLIPRIKHPEPTPLQEKVMQMPLGSGPQLFILEDVTGSGKTEAALLLAHRMMTGGACGLYFGLPTMATANAMYERLGDSYRLLYEGGSIPSLVLAHSARDLSERFRQSLLQEAGKIESPYGDGEPPPASTHCSQWLADNRKKALLAEIGVGTIDQALLGILPSRHQSLRLLGLLDKVLLFDEIHACDAYMHALLCRLLSGHAMAGGSAILLSATLSRKQRGELIAAFSDGLRRPRVEIESQRYPLLTHYDGRELREYAIATRPSVCRRVRTSFVNQTEGVEAVLKEVVAKGECACWIRNSVADAREAYQRLEAAHPDWLIQLFHARFALADRLGIERRVVTSFGPESGKASRRGRILIATQVIEQSLDVDFDRLITDLAPIDLLIQRAGRLHRHNRDAEGNPVVGHDRRDEPTLTIYGPSWSDQPGVTWFKEFFPRAAFVYPDHGRLWLGMKLLLERGGFSMPEDARPLIEGVYGQGAEPPEGLMQASLGAEGAEKAAASFAIQNALDLDAGYSREGSWNWIDEAKTPTRLGEESTTVWLARWRDGQLGPWCEEGEFRWQRSTLTLRSALVCAAAPNDAIPAEAVDDCLAQLPAKGEWGVLLPLVEKSPGQWQGFVKTARGERSALYYNSETGLMTAQEL